MHAFTKDETIRYDSPLFTVISEYKPLVNSFLRIYNYSLLGYVVGMQVVVNPDPSHAIDRHRCFWPLCPQCFALLQKLGGNPCRQHTCMAHDTHLSRCRSGLHQILKHERRDQDDHGCTDKKIE
jgi:hypothetical protein